MDATGFIPPHDAGQLSHLSSQTLLSMGELMQAMTESLHDVRRAELGDVLEAGGSLGIQATVDRKGERTLKLISIQPNGEQRTEATMLFSSPPAKR